MEFGGVGGGGGEDQDLDDPQGRKKRYHRHTASQIQKLEAMFKEFPHPDEKHRLQLSRDLGLSPRQIKFWFQNRRTQMKAQHERADNCALRAENDKIRCENIAIREALKNVICLSCGGPPPLPEDSYFDEQKLRIENAQLKEELDRVSSIAAKYIGRPISQLPPVLPIRISSLDLSTGGYGGQVVSVPSLDLDPDLVQTSSNPPFQPLGISDTDKSLMADIAANAMDELLRLLQTNEPLWIRSSTGVNDVLDQENYQRMFPTAVNHLKDPNVRVEASRDSVVVLMNSLALLDMFVDSNRWVELFPSIVSTAKTIEVVSSGMSSCQTGSLELIYQELHVLSPLVPTREFYILRYCQQVEIDSWAIVNVSYDISQFTSYCRMLPSGCLIQDMPNGYSKVTWVEHVVIEDKTPIHDLYRDLIQSGAAFGAGRWLSTLQRMCERITCQMVSSTQTRDLVGVIPSPDGKRSMMKLSHRMVKNFCASISTSNSYRRTTISGLNEVRITIHSNLNAAQPHGVILSAATTFWLPVSPQNVFNFFKDERTRAQWDVLSNGNEVQEVAHIANGSHPGNTISVLRAFNTNQNNMLILQESCIDSSGSLIVYCPVDIPAINIVMSGEDPSCIPLLPSGFSVTSDGHPHPKSSDGASTSSEAHGSTSKSSGSLITVAFQILVSNLPSARLNPESITTVNNLINTTVHQIKAALNCLTC